MLSDIAAVFGIIGGIIAIFTIVYMTGFWKRGVEDDIVHIKKDITEINVDLKKWNLPSFCMMVQTLWDVYVIDTLHKRPDIAQFKSPPKLTQKGLDYIPEDVKEMFDRLEISINDRSNISSGYLAVQIVGLDRITKLASEKDLSIQEMIAVLSTYLSSKLY
jgi:hypothetical protein